MGRSAPVRKQKKAATRAYPDNNPKTLLGILKPSLSKVPPAALLYIALGFMDGATKYGAFNWRTNKVSATIYVDACLRHLEAWFDGEELAEDSLFPHLAHAMACLAIIVDAKEQGCLIDDRPPAGSMARLLKKWTAFIKDRAEALKKREKKEARAKARKKLAPKVKRRAKGRKK